MSETRIQPIQKRLRIIQGQVAGLEKMIGDTEIPCTHVLVQLKAVMSGMRAVGNKIVAEALETCLTEESSKNKKDELIQSILKLHSSI